LASSFPSFGMKLLETGDFTSEFIVIGASCVGLSEEVGKIVFRLTAARAGLAIAVHGSHQAITEKTDPIGAVDGFLGQTRELLMKSKDHRQHGEPNDDRSARDANRRKDPLATW
jgi:hypothetical protein